MQFAYHNQNEVSQDWSLMNKSKNLSKSVNGSQDFENLDMSQSSVKSGRARSLSQRENEDLDETWGRRQETYIEMIKDLGTNLKYNLGFLSQSIYFKDGGNIKKAYLLGKEYEISVDGEEKQDQLEKLRRDFSNIIWFSYRKNFPKLNHQILPSEESYVSDTGWGCTIRSCQMLFAECLKRCIPLDLNSHKPKSEDRIMSKFRSNEAHVIENIAIKSRNKDIVSWFLDSVTDPKQSPYSIQKLSSHIYEKSKIRPGNWLKPSTVLYTIQAVHESYNKYTAQNLQIEICIEGTIYLNQVIKKVGAKPESEEQEEDLHNNTVNGFEIIEDDSSKTDSDVKTVSSPVLNHIMNSNNDAEPSIAELFEEDGEEAERLLKTKWKESLMIVILAKIGLEKPNPEYLPFIKELLSFPEFVGMLGGKPGLAYYIVGCMEDRLMYLDPHFVQETVHNKKDLKNNINTYFCNSIRYLNINDIDTSVGFTFWIKDEIAFHGFVKRFKTACQKKESFVCMEVNAPNEADPADFESVDGEDEFDCIALK